MGQAKHRARRARVQQAGAAAELSADARTTGPSGRAQAGGRGTHRLLTDCPAAEEGAAAALLPPVVGDPIAVWLMLPFEEQKRHTPLKVSVQQKLLLKTTRTLFLKICGRALLSRTSA